MDKENVNLDITGGWVAMQQRYFLSSWIPAQTSTHHYYSNSGDNNVYTIGLTNAISVSAGQQKYVGARLYVGPEIAKNLKTLAI